MNDITTPVQIIPSTPEPPEGSVVMKDGLTGTAFQRHYSDGLWHSTTDDTNAYSWNYFINRYDPKMAGDFIVFTPEHVPVEETVTIRATVCTQKVHSSTAIVHRHGSGLDTSRVCHRVQGLWVYDMEVVDA